MIKIVNGIEVVMTIKEVTAWEAERAAYVPPDLRAPNPETILRQAMFDDFVDRASKDAGMSEAIKNAALAWKLK